MSGTPARATICSGICGFVTTVEAKAEDLDHVRLSIVSECQEVQKLAAELTEVSALQVVSFRGDGSVVHQLAVRYLPHAACLVPIGIIKATEVAAGLALPADATINMSKGEVME